MVSRKKPLRQEDVRSNTATKTFRSKKVQFRLRVSAHFRRWFCECKIVHEHPMLLTFLLGFIACRSKYTQIFNYCKSLYNVVKEES